MYKFSSHASAGTGVRARRLQPLRHSAMAISIGLLLAAPAYAQQQAPSTRSDASNTGASAESSRDNPGGRRVVWLGTFPTELFQRVLRTGHADQGADEDTGKQPEEELGSAQVAREPFTIDVEGEGGRIRVCRVCHG